MGGSSSSNRTESTTNNTSEVHNTDSAGNAGIVLANASDNTVNVLDGGAIKQAFDFAGDGMQGVLQLTADNLSQSSASQDRVLSAAAMGLQAATGEGISSSGKQITTAIIVAGVVALIWVIKR
jgi:hypothetical protein